MEFVLCLVASILLLISSVQLVVQKSMLGLGVCFVVAVGIYLGLAIVYVQNAIDRRTTTLSEESKSLIEMTDSETDALLDECI